MKHYLITTMSVGILSISLAACSSHQDPLSKVSKEEAAKFLVYASKYAEQKLGNDKNNYAFSNCMEHKNDKDINCQSLYSKMLEYAKTKPDYQQLTKADLINREVWLSLKDYYQGRAFETL